MNDWRGSPILPGAVIVYPGRHGSRLWMVEGEVMAIGEKNRDPFDFSDRIPFITVQPTRETGWRGERKRKPVTLTSIERITVIQEAKEVADLRAPVR